MASPAVPPTPVFLLHPANRASSMTKRPMCIVLPPDPLFVRPAATTLPWFFTAANLRV
jgi:hypothetical protein